MKIFMIYSCKSTNVIYLAQCTICDLVQDNGDINCYAGQTIQPLHKRVNGHRSCFDVIENLQIWEKSALSKHAYKSHQDYFDIRNFKIMAFRQGCTTSLNRLEAKTINELRLGVLGLNRMKIQKEWLLCVFSNFSRIVISMGGIFKFFQITEFFHIHCWLILEFKWFL